MNRCVTFILIVIFYWLAPPGFVSRGSFLCALRRSAFRSLLDSLHVRQILPPSGCEFSGYEVVAGKKSRRCAGRLVDYIFNAAVPCCIEIHTGDLGENIDGYRLAPHSEE